MGNRTTRRVDRMDDRVNEQLNLKYIGVAAKSCPGCKMAITKSAGCNKMRCGSCGTKFCWLCGKSDIEYDHFSSSKCVLFDKSEIALFNNRFNDMMNRRAQQRWENEVNLNFANNRDDIGNCPRCG